MTEIIRRRRLKTACAAALALVFAWPAMAPEPASAQLLGRLVVNMTSPTSGSTVSGVVPLTASVSIIGLLTVVGVQFYVDGVPVGTEDRSAPYSQPWDTTLAGGGTHTIKAVARDLLGLRFSSGTVTVTVLNDPTPPTVSVSAPAPGSTVSGTIAVDADASDNAGVAGVQFRLDDAALGAEDATPPYSVAWDTATVANGTHTLHAVARDAAGNRTTSSPVVVTVANVTAPPSGDIFAPGDIVISLETGPVQWRRPDGTLNRTLVQSIAGTGEGLEFDPSGNLYVTRWCIDASCSNGNTVEMYDDRGQPLGSFGAGYDCAPHAIAFDGTGTAYVGQAACTGAILKFVPGQPPQALAVAPENGGSFWIDVAGDGCTIFYTSFGVNVKRFDACTGQQLPDFNAAPLPGTAQDLRILPDGGVIVSSGEVIARLNAAGALVQTYGVPGEPRLWAGVDLVGDGTFWVGNYESSNVYRFDLASGTVVSRFNSGTPAHTVVGVSVKK